MRRTEPSHVPIEDGMLHGAASIVALEASANQIAHVVTPSLTGGDDVIACDAERVTMAGFLIVHLPTAVVALPVLLEQKRPLQRVSVPH